MSVIFINFFRLYTGNLFFFNGPNAVEVCRDLKGVEISCVSFPEDVVVLLF
jgi:hypothetical protein